MPWQGRRRSRSGRHAVGHPTQRGSGWRWVLIRAVWIAREATAPSKPASTVARYLPSTMRPNTAPMRPKTRAYAKNAADSSAANPFGHHVPRSRCAAYCPRAAFTSAWLARSARNKATRKMPSVRSARLIRPAAQDHPQTTGGEVSCSGRSLNKCCDGPTAGKSGRNLQGPSRGIPRAGTPTERCKDSSG